MSDNFDPTFDVVEHLGIDKPINHAKPLISVCITAYQHRDYIEQCLDSVLAQKCDFPYEILLGEDESSDGTRDICIKYAENHPDKIRLFLHSRKNNHTVAGGATGKNNFLNNLKLARGTYIAFCDGDDYWISDEKLQKQVVALSQTHDSLICFHRTRCIEDNIGDCGIVGDFGNNSDFINISTIIRKRGGAMPMASIMINRQLISLIIEHAYKLSGLHYFIQAIGAVRSSYGALYLPETMACYRRNSSSSVTFNLYNTTKGKLESSKRNLLMLNIIQDLSDTSLQSTIRNARNKIIRKAIASELIDVMDIKELCRAGNVSLFHYAILPSAAKLLIKRMLTSSRIN